MTTGRFRAISAFLLAAVCAYASASSTRRAEARGNWEGWAFMMGDWVGTATGPVHEDSRVYTSGTARRK